VITNQAGYIMHKSGNETKKAAALFPPSFPVSKETHHEAIIFVFLSQFF
jgi:hypothetical protein